MEQLLARDPQLWLSRSWTTRDQRPGEADDAYRFVSRDEFEAEIADGGFIEHAEFLGNLYGTPWPDADDDRDVVLEIDVQGAGQVRDRMPDAVLIFLTPPSLEELERRLRGRGTEDEDLIRRRLATAADELERRDRFDHVVVNDDLDRAVDEVTAIIE
ncbi:MAG: guanylate kinase, partial [Acidimicrobiales bacterium]